MTTNIVNKWRLDITGSTSSRSVTSRQHSDTTSALLSPPGFKASSFSATASQQTDGSAKADHQQQQQLLSKRAWDIAFGPAKSLPMNMFMMYMAGNTISIFPIMMVAMMVWRPIKALMSVSGMFRPIESEISSSLILHKLVFILGNLGAVGLAVYKCHSMGLLPNHASDWLDFAVPPERVQHALVGEQFI